MPITIDGSGSITGLSAGGLPDGTITTADIQDAAITAPKLSGGQSGSAPVYGCRAWVRFDGTKDTTGATSTANTNRQILGSGNVTSVLRNSVGNYTLTLTTALPDANAAVLGSGLRIAVNEGVVNVESISTTQVVINCTNGAGLESDFPIVSVAVFR